MLNYEEYAAIDAVNWSIIKLMDSPAKAKWAMDNPGAGDTASRGMLRALHCLVLEPENFDRDFAVCSVRRDKRTVAYRAFLADAGSRTVLSEREHSEALRLADVARTNPMVSSILSDGHTEVTMQWVDEVTGLRCKGRLDHICVSSAGVVITDLKNVPSVENHAMGRMCASMGWLGQAAHYVASAHDKYPDQNVRYQIIGIESGPCPDVGVFLLDDVALQAGEMVRRPLLNRYAQCKRSGKWPGRYEAPVWLDVPDYALPQIDSDDHYADEWSAT